MGDRTEDSLVAPRAARAVLFASALVFGAWLRFEGLGRPSYWLDEILGQQLAVNAATQPWWHWLTGLEPDQGPLYFATQLVGNETIGRLLPALFGMGAIAAMAACRLRDRSAAIIAAMLLALSPLHVYYSREARPYSLTILLTTLVIGFLLVERRDDSAASDIRTDCGAAFALLLLLYSHASAGPVVLSAAIAALLARRYRLAVTALFLTACFPLLYRGASAVPTRVDLPGNTLVLVARSFTVSAFGENVRGRATVALIALAVIGAAALWKRHCAAAVTVLVMTLSPVILAAALLQFFGHWFAVRYVSGGLPGFLLLCGYGLSALATWIGRREVIAGVVVVGALAAIGHETVPAARTEPFRKLDWRAIAATIRAKARPRESVLAAEPWSEVSLRYYLDGSVHVLGAPRVAVAKMLLRRGKGPWIVSAGYGGEEMRGWMCNFPIVMSSALESFRLHYIGSQRDLFFERATPSTVRALAAAFGGIQPDDNVFFREGWADSEGRFRWAVAKHAAVIVPRFGRGDGVIEFHALPMGRQKARVSVNGTVLTTIDLAPAWSTYSVRVPAAVWTEGWNTIAFDFDHAASPGATDPRPLAASFEWIRLDGKTRMHQPLINGVRLDADRFIDAESAWTGTRTHFPASRLNRPGVEALLGRLGFDPAMAWPRLASGEIHLEDVVETVASGSDCEDGRAFLQRAFAVLLERPPNLYEARDLLARMHAGTSRTVIVGRIVKSDDFRAVALSSPRR